MTGDLQGDLIGDFMELLKIEGIIESVLFAAGDKVPMSTLCGILEIDKNTLHNIMNNLIDKYKTENRGIQVIQIEDCFQLCTKPEYFDYIKQLKEQKNDSSLSQAALETLAIIAYKQPITKAEIEQIRGVGCYTSILRLMEKNLVKELDRMDAPGKPILYGTTDEFLRSFGFKSLNDLPLLEAFLEVLEEREKEEEGEKI